MCSGSLKRCQNRIEPRCCGSRIWLLVAPVRPLCIDGAKLATRSCAIDPATDPPAPPAGTVVARASLAQTTAGSCAGRPPSCRGSRARQPRGAHRQKGTVRVRSERRRCRASARELSDTAVCRCLCRSLGCGCIDSSGRAGGGRPGRAPSDAPVAGLPHARHQEHHTRQRASAASPRKVCLCTPAPHWSHVSGKVLNDSL